MYLGDNLAGSWGNPPTPLCQRGARGEVEENHCSKRIGKSMLTEGRKRYEHGNKGEKGSISPV